MPSILNVDKDERPMELILAMMTVDEAMQIADRVMSDNSGQLHQGETKQDA